LKTKPEISVGNWNPLKNDLADLKKNPNRKI
jgi:hypothetical protein